MHTSIEKILKIQFLQMDMSRLHVIAMIKSAFTKSSLYSDSVIYTST